MVIISRPMNGHVADLQWNFGLGVDLGDRMVRRPQCPKGDYRTPHGMALPARRDRGPAADGSAALLVHSVPVTRFDARVGPRAGLKSAFFLFRGLLEDRSTAARQSLPGRRDHPALRRRMDYRQRLATQKSRKVCEHTALDLQ